MRRTLTVLLTALALLGLATGTASASTTLDGFRVGHVPRSAGPVVTDFPTTWEDVDLVSRVWESPVDGGHREDLSVTVLRGPTLTDADALLAFTADWLEQDPATWTPFTHPDGPGFRDDHRLFWLVEPGVAAMVRVDVRSIGERGLVRTARGLHPLTAGPQRAATSSRFSSSVPTAGAEPGRGLFADSRTSHTETKPMTPASTR